MSRTELTRGPLGGEFAEFFFWPVERIPGKRQEEFHGKFHGFEISHVDDPHALGTVLVSKVHLFPDFGNGIGIDPLVGTRTTNVIKMVVDARAAAALALFSRR